jgi:N-acetylglucosaminyldiphosphoundecaprenol N-acetyl-beta-D-mannosaminyltransferase
MVPRLLDLCARDGRGVYFFGSDEATLAQARQIAEERYPGLRVVGYESPPMGAVVEWDNEAICRRMRESGAHLLLACLGCPKQERWIHAHHRECGIPLSIGVGASLDFITGKQRRAPRWMQRTGLEWLWRLSGNPQRLVARYWADLNFLIRGAAAEWWLRRRRERVVPQAPVTPASPAGAAAGIERLRWSGSLTRESVEAAPFPARPEGDTLLDLSGVSFMDSAGLGRMAGLIRTVREAGGRMVVCGRSDFAQRAMEQAHFDDLVAVEPNEAQACEWLAKQGASGRVERGGETVRVAFQGSLDAVDLTVRQRILFEAIEETAGDLVLDLSQVSFIDSRAVGMLIAVQKRLSGEDRQLWLESPNEAVRRVIALLKLETVLKLRPRAA